MDIRSAPVHNTPIYNFVRYAPKYIVQKCHILPVSKKIETT
jgi:hypothetical protein